jgi:hypothetical protein
MLAAMVKSMNRVLHTTITEAAKVVELRKLIKLTGGMATPTFVAVKQREIPGFTFQVVQNCAPLGNVGLVRYHTW